MVREISFVEAIREAIREEMRRDKTVFVMGEDVTLGVYAVTRGLSEEFGEERVRDTPLAEDVILGATFGAALAGMRPVTEIMYSDFITCGIDHVINGMAKYRYVFSGNYKVPCVVRAPIGAAGGLGCHHSQSPEAMYMHVPGLRIIVPSTPYDAKGLMKTAIRHDDPDLFFEPKLCYRIKGPVPEEEYTIPLGQADIKRKGENATIVTYGPMVQKSLDAAEELNKMGLNVEVIDLRTLSPLDKKTIMDSVKKTGRVVIVEEGCKTAGVGAEIAALISEEAFDYLDAPVRRVAAKDSPIPFNIGLENVIIPQQKDIVDTLKDWI